MRGYLRLLKRAIRSVLHKDPLEILAYYGYGNSVRAHVHGRVLEVRNVSVSTDSDSSFRNLLNTYRRAEADPIPFARVKIEYGDKVSSMTADDEGFFSGWIDLATPLASDDEWNKYKVSLVVPLPAGEATVSATGEVLLPPKRARFGVISDIDD